MGFTKFFLRLIFAVLVLVGVILLIGTMISRDYSLEATVTIPAPREKVFAKLNDLRQWQDWSEFSVETNKGIQSLNYGATTEGKDASLTWTDQRGSGKLWITETIPNESLKYIVEFGRFPRMHAEFDLVADSDEQTTVRWTSAGRLPPGPFYGWFGMYVSENLKQQYERNLEKLSQLFTTQETPTEEVKEPSE
ncbi:MAG: SRPBCC family protein [Pirellulaceae bacterium]